MKAEGKKVPSNLKESLDRTRHFVSGETEQHKPVPIDLDHAELVEAPAPNQEDHDVAEEQFTRRHETAEEAGMGEHPNRTVKKSSVAERHVTSEPGLKTAARRHDHVRSVRAQREKENFG